MDSIVAAQLEGDTTNELLDQILEETELENVQNCENEQPCDRTEISCGHTNPKNQAVSLCGRTDETCGRTTPQSDQTEENVAPITIPKVELKPLPPTLRYEFLG